MTSRFKAKLIRELRQEGASPGEAKTLAALGLQLRELRPDRQYRRYAPFTLASRLMLGTLAAGAAAVLLVAGSLVSLPGEPLHGVKRLSEAAALRLNPAVAPQIMADTSDEIQELVATKQRPALVRVALADYDRQFDVVRHHQPPNPSDRAAMEHCYHVLEATSDQASGELRGDIALRAKYAERGTNSPDNSQAPILQ